jgi:hypothetical protein
MIYINGSSVRSVKASKVSTYDHSIVLQDDKGGVVAAISNSQGAAAIEIVE